MNREIQRLVASVEQARSSVLDSVADLTDAQGAFEIAPDQWSVADILEHLYLAEISGVTKIWSAADELRAGRKWTQELPHSGKSIDQVVAETWKPKEAAPPIAVPHIGGPLLFWRLAFRSLAPLLAELADRLDPLPLEDVVFPHFLSGPLDARQRIEFLRFHMERHFAQIERIKSDPAFPKK